MQNLIPQDWQQQLTAEFSKPYFEQLAQFVEQEYATATIFPPREQIFRALSRCSLSKVKVVIIGQDPYHGDNQANGLSFSVREEVPFPPSLRNIFKEVCEDTGATEPTNGELERWADQGVLLLNATLTVRKGEAASHAKKGWEKFTDAIIAAVNREREGVVYILWGGHAQKKCAKIDTSRNHIISSVHPSPLSSYRGFFGSRPFSAANTYLRSRGESEIVW